MMNNGLRHHPQKFVLAATCAMAVAFLAGMSAALAAEASVIDGDTIIVDDRRVRLWGIDAPEIRQTCQNETMSRYRCGLAAAVALEAMVLGKSVTCVTVEIDRYGRDVARCSIGGKDIGGEMVRAGWAVDYRRYSKGAYAAEEAEAKAAMRGIWAGPFESPENWRHDPNNARPFKR